MLRGAVGGLDVGRTPAPHGGPAPLRGSATRGPLGGGLRNSGVRGARCRLVGILGRRARTEGPRSEALGRCKARCLGLEGWRRGAVCQAGGRRRGRNVGAPGVGGSRAVPGARDGSRYPEGCGRTEGPGAGGKDLGAWGFAGRARQGVGAPSRARSRCRAALAGALGARSPVLTPLSPPPDRTRLPEAADDLPEQEASAAGRGRQGEVAPLLP